MTWSWYWYNN